MASDQDVREQIVAAASRVYRKWGMKKTTMEDIAAEAGKGKATLYYYFKSKEEVFQSVLERHFFEIQQTIKQEMNKVTSATDKLKRYAITMFVEARKQVTVFALLKQEVREDKKLLYELRESFDSYDIHIIKEIMYYGFERGEFARLSAKEMSTIAYAVSSMIRGIVLNVLLDLNTQDDEERLETICEFVARGLRV